MVLGVTDVAGLVLTSVGVSQIPVFPGAQATWRRCTSKYQDIYLPLHDRLELIAMQVQMFRRRADFSNQLPMDLPESLSIERLQLAGDLINEASEMCIEYEKLPSDAQNHWGRQNGPDLQNKIETAERKIGLVARYAALHSQELILELAERVLRLEHHVEEMEEGGGGNGDVAEENLTSGDEDAVHDDEGNDGGADLLAILAIWTLVTVFAVTILGRAGRHLS